MPRGYPRYVLAVMVGINFLNYLDRYILPAVATKIQAEFHLTDGQVGLLQSAFLLVYAVATIPFGIWADRGVRKTVIGIGVTIWSLATIFTGLARSYAQLFAARGGRELPKSAGSRRSPGGRSSRFSGFRRGGPQSRRKRRSSSFSGALPSGCRPTCTGGSPWKSAPPERWPAVSSSLDCWRARSSEGRLPTGSPSVGTPRATCRWGFSASSWAPFSSPWPC